MKKTTQQFNQERDFVMTIRHQLLATLSVAALAISAGTGWSQSENAARAALEAAQAAADAAAEAADAATDDAVAAVEVAVAASGQAQCGPSIAGPWLGASAEESDISSVDEPLQARFLDEENNIFGFRVTDGNQRIRIEARSNADGDPSVTLLDSEGNEIGSNDDMENSLNSLLEINVAQGDYCLRMGELRDTVDVTVQVGRDGQQPLMESTALTCSPDTEAEAFAAESLELALAKGEITSAGSAERNRYLRFTLDKASPVSLRALGDGSVDPQIALFDQSGQRIAINDDADGRNSRLDFSPVLEAGRYCIGVGAVNGGAQGTITVSAKTLDPQEYIRRAAARGELPPVDDSYPVTPLVFKRTQGEVILQGSSANWFGFELSEPTLIGIRTLGSPSGVDTKLVLFDASGRVVQENDDSDDGRNARILPVLLAPGSYKLALTDISVLDQIGAPLRPVVILAEKYVAVDD